MHVIFVLVISIIFVCLCYIQPSLDNVFIRCLVMIVLSLCLVIFVCACDQNLLFALVIISVT